MSAEFIHSAFTFAPWPLHRRCRGKGAQRPSTAPGGGWRWSIEGVERGQADSIRREDRSAAKPAENQEKRGGKR